MPDAADLVEIAVAAAKRETSETKRAVYSRLYGNFLASFENLLWCFITTKCQKCYDEASDPKNTPKTPKRIRYLGRLQSIEKSIRKDSN